jgi:uncharacterized protein (TIGR00255 family)
MTLNSMTGFARADGSNGNSSWFWEVRSVNGRGLDLRVRLAPGLEALEPKVREAISRFVTRGSVSVSLNMQRGADAIEVRLNEEVVAQVIKAANRLRDIVGAGKLDVASLMAIKGVLEVAEVEVNESELAERTAAVLTTLEEALVQVAKARQEEGARLGQVLSRQLDEIEALVDEVERAPARQVDAVRQRLADLVGRLIETGQALDPARLHQEAVLIATRSDVEEELKRLRSHVSAARELLRTGGVIGRKLDFLAQEFNREANTLCSKSNDETITKAGLALKVLVDQMREQVQNIE